MSKVVLFMLQTIWLIIFLTYLGDLNINLLKDIIIVVNSMCRMIIIGQKIEHEDAKHITCREFCFHKYVWRVNKGKPYL